VLVIWAEMIARYANVHREAVCWTAQRVACMTTILTTIQWTWVDTGARRIA